jgi:DUF917 family protein
LSKQTSVKNEFLVLRKKQGKLFLTTPELSNEKWMISNGGIEGGFRTIISEFPIFLTPPNTTICLFPEVKPL